MKKYREDFLHFAIRKFLKENSWELIAGQYPNGSDDEVPSLNIMDPTLAKDNSPDHRRHSMNKLVPDIVALNSNHMLIVEIKPVYSKEDEEKIEYILSDRILDLYNALRDLVITRGIKINVPIEELIFIPCLGFGHGSEYFYNDSFCYFLVQDIDSVQFIGNSILKNILL
ncbi:hypothetical protein ACFLZT_00550 [Thermodesulfobacteriota bacterium]